MTARVTMRFRITGRVQGVGYRAWAATTARNLGLSGWVRNLTDGSVEALAHGPAISVQEFAAACRQGPSLAQVVEVRSTPAAPFAGNGFNQVPSGSNETEGSV